MMKTILYLLVFASTFSLAQTTATIQKKDQVLSWTGKAAVGNYAPQGTLDIQRAHIEYTKDSITALHLVVDIRSLQQENTQLRDHLKAEDFFYVEKFPTATFNIYQPITIENGIAKIIGKMTIKGITETEQVAAKISVEKEQITLTFTHTMDRTRYGVNHNSPSLFKKLKENAVADDFILQGNLVFKNN